MRTLLNPKWLLFLNTLPLSILFILCFSQYSIIESLLNSESIQAWRKFSLALGILGFLNLSYAVFLIYTKRKVSVWFSALALPAYIAFIYLYSYNIDLIIPWEIPEWMLRDNLFIYVGTFLMPTLFYSLVVLVIHFTSEQKKHKAWVSFLLSLLIPVLTYLFFQVIFPLWQSANYKLIEHTRIVINIVLVVVFLFFLMRMIIIMIYNKSAFWKKYELVWKIPIVLVLPIVGLIANNTNLFSQDIGSSGIFGNFNSFWFYLLTIINAVALCLPNLENRKYRISIFILRSITFIYTVYFFMVFLRFLPLSVLAIAFAGTGFLMLTPLVLIFIHIDTLNKDMKYLAQYFAKKKLLILSIAFTLLIPLIIHVKFYKDKLVLHETLDFVYSPDYSKDKKINRSSIDRTLSTIKMQKKSRNDFIYENTRIPYVSSYFTWLVLDNLTLSRQKLNDIERVIYGVEQIYQPPIQHKNKNVVITNIESSSTYDEAQGVWKSWVDVEISNTTENRLAEYSTAFELPDGCFISDYYLYVGDRKEYGILAEKKSAMWLFTQIKNESRDPGILYYLTGNRIGFKVFPFASKEVRRTGIEFLHKDPFTLEFDGNTLSLGEKDTYLSEIVDTEDLVYIPAESKNKLEKVQRIPYIHFIVDASISSKEYRNDLQHVIEQLSQQNKELSAGAKISFVDSYVNTMNLSENWKEAYEEQSFEGGFNLDFALRKNLTQRNVDNTYPIYVVVTDSLNGAIVNKDFADLQFAFPESESFYSLDESFNLNLHSFIGNPLQIIEGITDLELDHSVLRYPMEDGSFAYISNNNESSFILKNTIFDVEDLDIQVKNWESALKLQGQWRTHVLHPKMADKKWLNLVRQSFRSRIMTPLTSYIVVENEAQKAMLLKKQEQVLKAKKTLDLDEESMRMSEPGLLIFIGCFLLFYVIRQKRKIQSI